MGRGTTGQHRASRWLGALIGALVLAVVAATTVQMLPLPGGGTSKAGASVTPPATPTAVTGGRVSSDGTTGAASLGGGFHPDITERGGCESWGSNYTGTAYIHEAVDGGTVYGAWSVTASGGVTAEKSGVVPFYGSLQSVTTCPNDPVVGIAGTSDSKGYWLATSGGGVFSFGDAAFHGSGATGHSGTIAAIVADPGTSGYWLVSQLGQVYGYGGAGYHGGSPSTLVAAHEYYGESVAAMAATPTGGGYWMVTNYGVVYAYGNASIAGFSSPGLGGTNYDWYSGIGGGSSGNAFWLVRMDGQTYGVYESWFGNPGLAQPGDYFTSLADSTDGGGYLLTNVSGQYYAYGNAIHPTNPPWIGPPKETTPPPPAGTGTGSGTGSGSGTEQVRGSGNSATNYTEPCAGDPVNCESGDLWETDTDVTVPGRGPHLDLTRTYNSQDASTLGVFGYGWSGSYQMSVSAKPTTSATVTEADGSTVTFYTNTTAIFVAPEGTLATLTRKPTGGYTFRVRNTTTYVFNADGRLVAESDRNGYITALSYNSAGQLTTVTDPARRTITFAYNATGLVSSVTNPAGEVTTYAYTGKNLVSVTDPAGRATRYTYDATHRMVTETSPTGGVTTTHYNATDKVTTQTDPTDLSTTWAYSGTNATSGTTTITGPMGSVTKETFTGGQMTAKTTAYGTPSAATWHYTYTSTTFGQTSVTDPNGNTTSTTYDATGNVTSTTDPLGNTTTTTTTTTYNSFNEPLVAVDPMGITTTDTYDTHGNLTTQVVTGHGGSPTATTTYTYGDGYAGDVTKMTDPMGRVTTYTYDSYGDVVTTSLYSGTGLDETQDVYDVLGRKVCEVAPPAYAQGTRCPVAGGARVADTTTWTYDPDGEVVAETNPLTQTTSWAYDVAYGATPCTATVAGAAYCEVVTDPAGNVTVTYDDQDARQVGEVTGAGSPTATTTGTAYDVALGHGSCGTGVATALDCQITTNGDGQATVNYLDAATEIVKTVAPGDTVTTSTYDGAGNLITKTTAAGTTTDGYDKDNRLTSVTYSDTASGFTQPHNVTYAYNADGQQTKMTDGTGSTTNTYDSLDRLTWVTRTTNGTYESVGYGYNLDNEVTSLRYTDGRTVHRTYNGAGQMTSTTDLQGQKTTFAYQPSAPGVPGGSQMTTVAPNGMTTTTVDNALGQQVTTSLSSGGHTKPSWWRSPAPNGGDPSDISCPSTTLCVGITENGVLTSTDPTGGTSAWTETTVEGFQTMAAISCPSTTLCVAGGRTGYLFTSTDPTGGPSAWTETTVGNGRVIAAISCPSASLCVAVSTGEILTSTDPAGGAGTWHSVDITGTFASISCPTTTFCVAGGWTGNPFTSTDPTGGSSAWTRTQVWAGSNARPIIGVSCPSTTLCEAVTSSDWVGDGSATQARVYTSVNPTTSAATWIGIKLPGTTTANAISCPSTTFCVATGDTGTVWTSTNPAWGEWGGPNTGPSTGVDGDATVITISCPAVTLCAAGDWTAGILVMTGVPTTRRFTDTYSVNGLLTGESDIANGAATAQATYGYDDEDQLTTSAVTGATGATGTYGYDAAGNPTSVVAPTTGTGVTQTFNSAGELTSATPSGGGTTTFGYDALGDRAERSVSGGSTATYSYDQVAELTHMTTGTISASYSYNGDGLRMSADITAGWYWTSTAGSWTRRSSDHQFTWDTETQTPQLLSDGSDYFIYGPTGQVIEEEGTTRTRRDPLYLVHDALGSTVAMTNSTQMVSTYTYNAYGATVGHTGPDTTPIGFAGAYTDEMTGLLYMEHRYYTPGTGEFISVDPDVGTTHEPYEYAGDDPVNKKDPSGLDCAGGPTTPTALASFADAYGGWELEQYADAYEGYQLEEFSAAYAGYQLEELSATLSQARTVPKIVNTCLLLLALLCGPVKPGPTDVEREKAWKPPAGIGIPAPPGVTPPPVETAGGATFSWETAEHVLETAWLAF